MVESLLQMRLYLARRIVQMAKESTVSVRA